MISDKTVVYVYHWNSGQWFSKKALLLFFQTGTVTPYLYHLAEALKTMKIGSVNKKFFFFFFLVSVTCGNSQAGDWTRARAATWAAAVTVPVPPGSSVGQRCEIELLWLTRLIEDLTHFQGDGGYHQVKPCRTQGNLVIKALEDKVSLPSLWAPRGEFTARWPCHQYLSMYCGWSYFLFNQTTPCISKHSVKTAVNSYTALQCPLLQTGKASSKMIKREQDPFPAQNWDPARPNHFCAPFCQKVAAQENESFLRQKKSVSWFSFLYA